MLSGTRVTLFVPAVALVLSAATGTALGLLAGYFGGWVDGVLMRLVDIQLAFPILLLAISVIAVLPPSLYTSFWSSDNRLGLVSRVGFGAQALRLRDRESSLGQERSGAPHARILLKHVLPNVIPTVVVLMTLQGAQFVLLESALSFLALGAPPSTASWGRIMNDGLGYLVQDGWIVALPGAAIVVLVVAMGLLGDWARDALDPTLRSV